jgi:hypothetical protein
VNRKLILLVLLAASNIAMAADQEQEQPAEAVAADSAPVKSPAQEGAVSQSPEAPKALSGMSILGNEEAPKALVIVPWKSSELGDDLSLNDSLDDRAKPVDREVFLRELSYYEIRSGR